ncbi:hypothetical protein LIA77_07637 [Sarocladium implicatum]|nr:hypothetical protein LIA77_07637 [Sarocladium implicatum]
MRVLDKLAPGRSCYVGWTWDGSLDFEHAQVSLGAPHRVDSHLLGTKAGSPSLMFVTAWAEAPLRHPRRQSCQGYHISYSLYFICFSSSLKTVHDSDNQASAKLHPYPARARGATITIFDLHNATQPLPRSPSFAHPPGYAPLSAVQSTWSVLSPVVLAHASNLAQALCLTASSQIGSAYAAVGALHLIVIVLGGACLSLMSEGGTTLSLRSAKIRIASQKWPRSCPRLAVVACTSRAWWLEGCATDPTLAATNSDDGIARRLSLRKIVAIPLIPSIGQD